MVKVTIQVEGKEDKVIEGTGLIFSMNTDDKVRAGVVGTFSLSELQNAYEALVKAFEDCVGEFIKEESEEK